MACSQRTNGDFSLLFPDFFLPRVGCFVTPASPPPGSRARSPSTTRHLARPPPPSKKIKQHTINQSIKPSQAGLVLVRSSSRFEAIRASATPQKEARPPGRSSPRTIETWPSFSDAIRLPRLLRHRCEKRHVLGGLAMQTPQQPLPLATCKPNDASCEWQVQVPFSLFSILCRDDQSITR